jgi:antitoxin MazE
MLRADARFSTCFGRRSAAILRISRSKVGAVITKLQKWGNSQGLRLSKELLSNVGIEVGDEVDVKAVEGSLVVTPVRRVRGGVDLAELVREIPADYSPSELVWGPPTGREVW